MIKFVYIQLLYSIIFFNNIAHKNDSKRLRISLIKNTKEDRKI